MNKSEISVASELFWIVSDQWMNLALWVYLVVIFIGGIILQLIQFLQFIGSAHNNGFNYFLLQLTFADVINLLLCYFDIFYIFSHEWIFGDDLCGIMSGLLNFSSTAITYVLLTMNLHAVSTANLACKALKIIQSEEEKSNFINEEVESTSDTYDTLEQKRTLTIDYSGPKWKTSINVIFPTLIIWILSLSISMPTIIISALNREFDENYCIILRSSFGAAEVFTTFVKIILPMLVFIPTIFILFRKRNMLKKIEEHYIDENPIEIIQITLIITITYLVLQLPKIIFDIISTIIETEHNKMFYMINCITNTVVKWKIHSSFTQVI
ncbi:unnamed protein product [Chironomus riparius]|uniref:G-protein coupled receptors family 1 profile domain-containing protein n=1 Tax=Chironomus riparius TaxID=315576 RepID=A0A9N9RK08_9DIPT|nr:unnamed protein product [Chironomus riparius]